MQLYNILQRLLKKFYLFLNIINFIISQTHIKIPYTYKNIFIRRYICVH